MTNKDEITKILIKKGKELLNEPYKKIEFSKNPEADELINDIENYPQAFVLACLIDRQIKAEKAWLIPYEVSREINGFKFSKLLKIKLEDIKIFLKEKIYINLMI